MKSHQGNEFPKANRKKVIAMKKSEQENIITVSHLNKEFVKDGTSFQVLKDIDLSVKKESLSQLWDTAAAERVPF